MTDQQHPIVPPQELLEQWEDDWYWGCKNPINLLIQAFQAGADQELEACCGYIVKLGQIFTAVDLQTTRRPEPLTLKAQALRLIDNCNDPDNDHLDDEALAIIRRALETLDD
jgi:hypothetical protein